MQQTYISFIFAKKCNIFFYIILYISMMTYYNIILHYNIMYYIILYI